MTAAVTVAQSGAPGVSLGFKNRIINGGMAIDQRNAGASYAQINNAYNLDRWAGVSFTGGATTGKYTVQQNAGSVTPPVGFTKYLGLTSAAATSTASNDIYVIRQPIEGLNIGDLAWGTANAKTITVSFWVRSSVAGTFGGAIQNESNDYNYPFTYSISATGTWEYKTVTISGPTTGTWQTTTAVGMTLVFQIQVGSTYSDTANAWTTKAAVYGATGCTNLLNTNGATWYITGVQLEVGTAATQFEFRDYGRELIMCYRYYEKTGLVVISSIGGKYPDFYWKAAKRATPTVTVTPAAGSGANVDNFAAGYGELMGGYQSANHSTDTNSLVIGSAEL